MIYRAPPVVVVVDGVGAPGGHRNDFTSTTSAARAFLFVLLRPEVRAGVVAASREEGIHYADRAPPGRRYLSHFCGV